MSTPGKSSQVNVSGILENIRVPTNKGGPSLLTIIYLVKLPDKDHLRINSNFTWYNYFLSSPGRSVQVDVSGFSENI